MNKLDRIVLYTAYMAIGYVIFRYADRHHPRSWWTQRRDREAMQRTLWEIRDL